MLTKEFFTAGRAIFTIEIPGGDFWQTFRIKYREANGKWPEAYFVELLTGPDNTNDYRYLGMLNPNTGDLRVTARSCAKEGSQAVDMVRAVLRQAWGGRPTILQVRHEGRCCRCSRRLTTPLSLTTGIGPECAGRAPQRKERKAA